MTFLQLFLFGICFRAGWFAFNWLACEVRYLYEYYIVHPDVRDDLYRKYWDRL